MSDEIEITSQDPTKGSTLRSSPICQWNQQSLPPQNVDARIDGERALPQILEELNARHLKCQLADPSAQTRTMTVVEYNGYRIEVSSVGKGWRASIFSPGSTRPGQNSPANLEKSSEEEIVAEAKARGIKTSALWISRDGTELTPISLHYAIRRRTREAFGAPIPPHWFRDAEVTLLARDAPASETGRRQIAAYIPDVALRSLR
jgi:hypothetical protein